jgi:DNA-binding transcriptional LysR family regulator
MHTLDWSDLRYVLAVAREGSAAAAARAIEVSHSTVVRRVRAFEERNRVRIFDHLASGYRLTEAGEKFLRAARSIDAQVQQLAREMEEGEDELSGTLRITTTDTLFPLIYDEVVRLRETYPRIRPNLLVTNAQVNLNDLAADIAIRPTLSPPPKLIGRRICKLGFAVYALASALEAEGGATPSTLPWLGLAGPLATSSLGTWLDEQAADTEVVLRADSFQTLAALAERGAGQTILPCFVGDACSRLRRVYQERLDFSNDLWLLHHEDMLRSRSARVVADALVQGMRARADRLEG